MCNPDYDDYARQEYEREYLAWADRWRTFEHYWGVYLEVEPPQIKSEINITIKGM